MSEHSVVIVGGGFGGLYAAKALRNQPVKVTVVDRRNFHLFQPMLYQVATGGLSPGDIAAPLRSTLRKQKNTEVVLAEVTDIDIDRKRVVLSHGELEYDSLILATGATHSYFGHEEWEPVAPGLKSLEDATEIRGRMLYAFEAAETETSSQARQEWLTFVIVGAGPTGVELAGAIGEIATKTLREEFRHIRPEEACILLLDAAPRILQTFPEHLSKKAEESLIRIGVRTRCNVRVSAIDSTGVNIGSEHIAARTVFWAAGVQASPIGQILAKRTGVALDRAGRVMVQPDLTIPGHPEIYVVGDLAHCVCSGTQVPGVCQGAMQMGVYAAKRITGRGGNKPFDYFNKGNMAVIGRAAAVSDFGKFTLSGYLAWLAWLFIHLMYLVGFQNRVLVFVQWGFHYFTFNRGARLITQRK